MVVITNPGPRPQYYDRSGTSQWANADIAMGAATRVITVDWAYTVPAGKRAFVELIEASIRSEGTAVTNATAAGLVRLNDAAAATKVAYEARMPVGAPLGSYFPREVGSAAHLYAGETIQGVSFSDNNAANSAVRCTSSFKATEYSP